MIEARYRKGAMLFGRYLVQDRIGRGAMGEVWRGFDTQRRVPVAIKVLTPRGSYAELEHEARAVARLRHPLIARLFDYRWGPEGRQVLIMEYCPGRPLRMWLDELTLGEMLNVTDQVLRALAYAHARGVIHRDLKPANIMISEQANGQLEAMLIDFGVAKLAEDEHEGRKVAGTPAFMAPESLTQHAVLGPGVDLYALGVMLFEYITGRLPYSGSTLLAIFAAHASDPIPELEPRHGLSLPDSLAVIIGRLLAKTPEGRFRFAVDAAQALSSLELDDEVLASHPGGSHLHATHDDEPTLVVAAPSLESQGHTLEHLETLSTLSDVVPLAALERTPMLPGIFDADFIPLAGRRHERRVLLETLERVIEEHCTRLVVLTGPPGIGKTHLARWLCEQVHEQGLALPHRAGVGPAARIPGGSMPRALEQLLDVRGRSRAFVVEVMTGLMRSRCCDFHDAHLLIELLRPERLDHIERAQSRSRLDSHVALTARLLRGMAEVYPRVVWLDDLAGSFAGEAFELAELLILTRELSSSPLLLLITAREDSPLLGVLGSLSRAMPEAVTELRVGPLQHDETCEMLMSLAPLRSPLAEEIAGQSDGIARDAIATLESWLEDGALQMRNDSLVLRRLERPAHSTTTELLTRRLISVLAAVEPHGPAILAVMACLGEEPELRLVEAAIRQLEPAAISWVRPLWTQLIDTGVLDEPISGVGRWKEPPEPLTRLSDTPRARIHAALAETLDAERERGVPIALDSIAHHLEKGGDHDRAAEVWLAASRDHREAGGYGLALGALKALERLLGEGVVVDAARLREELDLERARLGLQRGDYGAAEAALDDLQAALNPARRPEIQARASAMRAQLLRHRGELDRAIPAFEKAFEELERADPESLGEAWEGLAHVMALKADYVSARVLANQARELYRKREDELALARLGWLDGRIDTLEHRLSAGRAHFRRAYDALSALGARPEMARVLLGIADTFLSEGQVSESAAPLLEAQRVFTDVGDKEGIVRCLWMVSTVELELGHPNDAQRTLRTALVLVESMGNLFLRARIQCSLGEIARACKDWDGAMRAYLAYRDDAEASGDTLSVAIAEANLGLVLLERGEPASAARYLHGAVQYARDVGQTKFLVGFGGCLALAELRAGNTGEASELMEEVLDLDADIGFVEPELIHALERFAAEASESAPGLAERAADAAIAKHNTTER